MALPSNLFAAVQMKNGSPASILSIGDRDEAERRATSFTDLMDGSKLSGAIIPVTIEYHCDQIEQPAETASR
jgi:hypothetical protein